MLEYDEKLALYFMMFFYSIMSFGYIFLYRKKQNIISLFLLLGSSSYIYKPFIISEIGGSLLYEGYFSWAAYFQGFIYTLLWIFMFLLGVFLAYPPKKTNSFNLHINYTHTMETKKTDKFFIVIILFGLTSMLAISGLSFLSFNRTEGGLGTYGNLRLIYPFVMLAGALLIARSFIVLFVEKNIAYFVFLLTIGIIATLAINQRGLSITFTLVSLLYMWNLNKKASVLYTILFVVFLALFSRNVLPYLNGDIDSIFFKESTSLETIARSPDGSELEVWSVILDYVKSNGYSLGETIVNIPMAVLPNHIRAEYGALIGLDVLNNHFDPYSYWALKYGFNVTTGQDFFLNFGFAGIIFSFAIGFFVGKSFVKYEKDIKNGHDPIYSFLYVYAIYNISSSTAGFQWTITTIFFYFLIKKPKSFVPQKIRKIQP